MLITNCVGPPQQQTDPGSRRSVQPLLFEDPNYFKQRHQQFGRQTGTTTGLAPTEHRGQSTAFNKARHAQRQCSLT